ncbi:MAG: aspartate kinase [Bryobacterales bacterium]|nr:aspartate kinase [Bryobacterales bacterium]
MQNLLVMKFGGTSMGSPESIRTVASICAEQAANRPTVAVVSAMSKVTDLMLETMFHAERGDEASFSEDLRRLRARHEETCAALIPEEFQTEVRERIESILAHFERIVRGMAMLRERPPRALDDAVSLGEMLSATLLVGYLESIGLTSAVVPGYSVIVTDPIHGNATPRMELTTFRAKESLLPLLMGQTFPVVTGFCGATEDGHTTTLGRGGSDFTATILAAALDAAEVWIWTDVDGIMSADPRVVPDAVVLPEITYNEAAELAYNGAKILHPRTLVPIVERNIPLWSKNTFNPTFPGTRIVDRTQNGDGARAVTSSKNVVLISVDPASASVNPNAVMARCLDAVARVNAEVLAFSSSSYRQSFCLLVRRDELADATRSIETALSLELNHGYIRPLDINDDVGLLAIVGEGMKGTPGLAGRIFTAISRERVNIIAISQGASELTIAIVVRRDGVEIATKAVHAECGLGTPSNQDQD